MRTASAAKFVMYYDGDADSMTATTPATTPQELPKGHESGDESDANKLATPKLYRPGSGEFRSGNRKNKIWDKVGNNSNTLGSSTNETRSEDNCPSSPDDREFGFSLRQPTMRKSASAFLERLTVSDGDILPEKRRQSSRCNSTPACVCAAIGRNALCECSEPESFLVAKAPKVATLNWQENVAEMSDVGSAEISMREALRATSPQKQSEGLQGRALERGAFGSFVNHEVN